ncbi:MAG TPA: T9SS type A sorting domain-containing protein, partial [Flavobacteriales bacterium]|nr:T9SS type A sorting domain-containing protein [Flavobacteriales bacterium]
AACGDSSTGAWITQFDNYDGAPSLDIDCRMNIGAYDPNDKTPSPQGVGEEHFIYDNTELEYLIRFQNTGTDTAFTIVVRDTISDYLDLTSIQPGASSHSYTWRSYGDNVQAVEFTFNNIQLPDSFVNEVASHGFIKYRINQKRSNPLGSIIQNTAAIYFDFNEPVFTNTTFHTIGEDFLESIVITAISENATNENRVKIYPNPFTSLTTFEFPNSAPSQLVISDALGRTVKSLNTNSDKIQLSSEGLANGLYFYRVSSNGKQIDAGKLIIQ